MWFPGHRQDTDYLLISVAISYGATVLQNTPVSDIDVQPDGVKISAAQGAVYRDVPCYNAVSVSPKELGIPFRWSEGILHHIFKGGWLWIIPFNNHVDSTNPLCSLGLQIDPRMYPARNDLPPEQEFYEFIDRFPKMKEQLKLAIAVGGWVRAGRLQYSSHWQIGRKIGLRGDPRDRLSKATSPGSRGGLFSGICLLTFQLLEGVY